MHARDRLTTSTRVATGPIGTGNATTSELLLSDYAAGAIQTVRVPVEQIADMLLSGKIDAAFTIFGIPHDEAGRAIKGGARLASVAGPTMNRLRNAPGFASFSGTRPRDQWELRARLYRLSVPTAPARVLRELQIFQKSRCSTNPRACRA